MINSNLKTYILVAICCFFIVSFSGCKKEASSESIKSYEKFAMGTIITQKISHPDSQNIANQVFTKISQIENTMTSKDANGNKSDVVALNNKSGNGEFVKLSKETFDLLQISKDISKKSNNSFNITLGPLIDAWGIGSDDPTLPLKDYIDRMLKLCNIKDLVLDKETLSAKLRVKGQKVDLGGIAKGYAGDKAIDIYKEQNVSSAFINLGGNVVLHGKKPDGSLWKVGVQNPRAPTGRYIGILELSDTSIVSSGDYERYFEKNGERYHHILDSSTGYPAKSGLIGVTIVYPNSTYADGLSTSAFILGLDKGMELVKSFNAGGIFITENKKVYVTDNLKSVFKMTEEGKEYDYVKNR